MSTEINLSHLFGTPVSMPIDNQTEEHGDAYKKAALLYHFSDKDLTDFSTEQVMEIIYNSKLLDKEKKIYVLNEDIRNKILAEEINNNQFEGTLKRLNIDSELSRTINDVLTNSDIDISTMSMTRLFFLMSSLKALPEKFNSEEIKAELNKKYFLYQFEKLTNNFAGRQKELSFLNDYVNWLPSKNFKGTITNIFRKIINWQEKPPLIIQGVGGIGKSTLLAQFILEQNVVKNGKMLPFVYIDFDLPGFNIKEPLAILIECLRQLSIQFHNHKPVFDEISKSISHVIDINNQTENSDDQSFNSSISTTRSALFNSLEQTILDYSMKLEKLDTPVLIIFDSFEEMQFRSSRDEMNNFLSFIREVSEKLPRIRPVFSGRAEMESQLEDFHFEKLEIRGFDKESAIALLEKNNITSSETAEEIFNTFGGTPLMLHLAMNMVKKDSGSLKDFARVNNQKKEYLIQRVLHHIHESKVRKVAVPGMLIRRIDAEIIKEVLARPCGLGRIGRKKAEWLFKQLKKETMLVTKTSSNDEIIFRPDLRMTCASLIEADKPVLAKKVSDSIINYYKERINKGIFFEAEYYFHILKSGVIPTELTENLYDSIKDYIGYSFQEFPDHVKVYLHSLLKTRASDRLVNDMTDEEWEAYYLMLLKKGLNGDLGYLRVLGDEINLRKDRQRLPGSEFSIYEALLYQRLGKFEESSNLIDKQIEQAILTTEILHHLHFIKIQNLEYQNLFDAAKVLSENLVLNIENSSSSIYNIAKIQYRRLCNRVGQNTIDIQDKSMKTSFNESNYQYTNWKYLLTDNLKSQFKFYTLNEFNEQKNKLISIIDNTTINTAYDSSGLQNFDKLEYICHHFFGVYTQSLSLTGEYEVIMQDFLLALEMKEIKITHNTFDMLR